MSNTCKNCCAAVKKVTLALNLGAVSFVSNEARKELQKLLLWGIKALLLIFSASSVGKGMLMGLIFNSSVEMIN